MSLSVDARISVKTASLLSAALALEKATASYLEFRLQQFKMLLDAVEDYVEEKFPATGGHS
jgi:hypothetical protein